MAALGLLLAKEEVAYDVVARFPNVALQEVYIEGPRGGTGQRLPGYFQLLFEELEYDGSLWPYRGLTRCPTCGRWQGTPAIAVDGTPRPFPMPLIRKGDLGDREVFLLGHRYRLLATEEARQWFVDKDYTGIKFMPFGAIVD